MSKPHDRTGPDIENMPDFEELFNGSCKGVFDNPRADADAKAGTRTLWGCAGLTVVVLAAFLAVVFAHRWIPVSLLPVYALVFQIVLMGLLSLGIYSRFRTREIGRKHYRENRQAAEVNARLGKNGGYCRNCGAWVNPVPRLVKFGSFYRQAGWTVPDSCDRCHSPMIFLYIALSVVVVASLVLRFAVRW